MCFLTVLGWKVQDEGTGPGLCPPEALTVPPCGGRMEEQYDKLQMALLLWSALQQELCHLLVGLLFVSTGSCWVTQTSLELLDSCDPSASSLLTSWNYRLTVCVGGWGALTTSSSLYLSHLFRISHDNTRILKEMLSSHSKQIFPRGKWVHPPKWTQSICLLAMWIFCTL